MDGVDITPDDMFRRVEAGGGIEVAAVRSGVLDLFTELLKEFDAIIHFRLAAICLCYQNACIAAEGLRMSI
jgi:hypothetical protein